MDFSIPTETTEHLAAVRAFLDREILPVEPLFLQGRWEDLDTRVATLQQQTRDRGWWAPHLPPEAGGSGAGLVELGLLSEVLGRSPLGHLVFGCNAPDSGTGELLWQHGSDEQKERFLKPMVRGDARSCFLLTEPENAGSDPTRLSTTAVKEDDSYRLNGHKWFATGADGAAFALVMAVTNPDAERHQRASMFLVPTDTPGYELVRNVRVMGCEGHGVYTHGECRLTDVVVSEEHRLGPEGAGFALAQARLGPGRIHHCMRWLGICSRALDEMVRRALEREVRPGTLLADTQVARGWIADSAAETAAARALVLQTAWHAEQDGFRAAARGISLIKFHVAGILQQVLDRAIQAHGALGVTDDTVLAFFYREERAARIYDGPDEVHRLSVAKKILRQAKEPGR